jgi:hypothetical protein
MGYGSTLFQRAEPRRGVRAVAVLHPGHEVLLEDLAQEVVLLGVALQVCI